MMRVNNTKRENSASSNSATAPTLLSAMQRQGLRGTPSWPRDLVLYAMVHSHTSWCQRHMLLWCQSVHKRAYPRLPTLNTLFHNGDRNEKVIGNLHPEPHHDQKLITSRGSPLAHFYHVWSTSFPHPWVILLTDTQTHRWQNERSNYSTSRCGVIKYLILQKSLIWQISNWLLLLLLLIKHWFRVTPSQ